MKQKVLSGHSVSGMFVFLLLGIFAVFCTVMVLLGVRAYRGSNERAQIHNDSRLGPAYIRSMVRALDEEDVLSIEDEDGLPVLCMTESWEGERYITRVYSYGGSLREWYASERMAFEPENGTVICTAGGLDLRLEEGLLKVLLQNADGTETETDIAVRCAAQPSP